MEKDKELQENKPTNTRLKMTIGILGLVVLSIVELYLMINYSDSYLFLGLVGLAILCFVYLVMDLSFKMHREQESSFEKDMESLYKAQKVSYITVKQGFAKFEELLDELGEELSFPLDEVLQAQKAVGRVTIQKNKENIDAVVESNEKLIEHLTSFEQKFAEIGDRIDAMQSAASSLPVSEPAPDRQEEILGVLSRIEGMLGDGAGHLQLPSSGGQQEVLDALSEIEDLMRREFGREPIKDRQQEILDYLARIEASVRDEISELEVHMESKIDEIPVAVSEEQKLSPEELDKILGETSALMELVQADLPEETTDAEPAVSGDAATAADFEIPEQTGEQEGAGEAGSMEMPIESAIADDFEISGNLTVSEGAVAADDFKVSGNLTMPEQIEISDGLGMTGDLTMPDEIEISDGLGMAGDLTMPDEMEISDGLGMTGDLTMPDEMEISDGLGMTGDLTMPDEMEISDGLGMTENLTMPDEVKMPDGSGLAGNLMMPDEMQISDGLGMTENLTTPEQMELAEDLGMPENLTMPEQMGISGESAIAEDFGMPEDLAMPELMSISGDFGISEETGIAAESESALSEAVSAAENEPEVLAGSEKVMTPDEIAAMLGSDIGEPEETAAEEAPPMPDLSDPGHVMTPEEIAALLANM